MDAQSSAISAGPFDEYYTAEVRRNLHSFHENLSLGQYEANGPLVSPDEYWNFDGTIILTRQGFTTALAGFVDSAIRGVDARDIYNIVDGNRGAVLFRISGRQTGPFLGLSLQDDARFNVRSAEHFTFDGDALTRAVVTVTPIGIMKAQMSGTVETPTTSANISLGLNPQTSIQFRERVRRNLASLHLSANTGDASATAVLATEDVEVDENGEISYGWEAFIRLVTAQNAGQGSFPDKQFHDFDVLADGRLGAVEYVWQAAQRSDYADIAVKDGAMVRMRGMLFFELNEDGLVEKAIGIYDEDVVNRTLTGTGGFLYP